MDTPKLSIFYFAVCEHCQDGKQTRNAHRTCVNSSSKPLDLVHTDVCGPISTRSLCYELYFVSFIDDDTRKVWVHLIKNMMIRENHSG